MTMHPTPHKTTQREPLHPNSAAADRTANASPAGLVSIGQCATWACLLEAAIPKPGNVHRGADFDDLTFYDFAAAAVAIGPAMEQAAAGGGVGRTVLDAVAATRRLAATNVNLGIVLLLAPLAAVPRELTPPATPLAEGVRKVLASLSADDSALIYEAIRLANPGGLGEADEADVRGPAPDDLLVAMRSAAERDAVARQYATDFADVFGLVVPEILRHLAEGRRLGDAVIRTHLRTMQVIPDTLIARKCGAAVAAEAALYAGQVLAAREGEDGDYLEALADFDFWLRSDGHRRNPGATADLIAAGLFAALRDGLIAVPPAV